AFVTPAPPAPPLTKPIPKKPFPPLIVPLLDRLVIVPAFDTPAPPAPPAPPPLVGLRPFPPAIVPLLDRLVIIPEFDTPAPPAPPAPLWGLPPFPPAIVPLLDRLVIIPAFDTPAPPAPPSTKVGPVRLRGTENRHKEIRVIYQSGTSQIMNGQFRSKRCCKSSRKTFFVPAIGLLLSQAIEIANSVSSAICFAQKPQVLRSRLCRFSVPLSRTGQQRARASWRSGIRWTQRPVRL